MKVIDLPDDKQDELADLGDYNITEGLWHYGITPWNRSRDRVLAAFDGVGRRDLPMRDSPAARAMSVGKKRG